MAVTLIADLIEDSGLQEIFQDGLWVQTAYRIFVVRDVASVASPSTFLSVAMLTPGLPARLSSYSPQYANCICVSRQVLPINSNDTDARIKCTFQTLVPAQGGGGSGFYIYTDTTSDVTVEMQCLPGQNNGIALPPGGPLAHAGEPFQIFWNGAAVAGAGNAGPGGVSASIIENLLRNGATLLPPQTVTAPIQMTQRTVVLRGYQTVNAAQKMAALRTIAGWANADTFAGRPPGYWRFNRLQDMSNDGRTYFVELGLSSFNFQDWGQIYAYVNRSNGVTYPFDPADYVKLRTAEYRYGLHPANGLLRIDPYPQINFRPIFGNIPA